MMRPTSRPGNPRGSSPILVTKEMSASAMLSAPMPDRLAVWRGRSQALAVTGVRSPVVAGSQGCGVVASAAAAVRSGVGAVSPAQVDAVAAVGASVVGDGQVVSRAGPRPDAGRARLPSMT